MATIMKLLFFSGGEYYENKILNKELLSLARRKVPHMVYIPPREDECESYYNDWKEYYKKFGGVNKFTFFSFDQKNSIEKIRKVFDSDIIFLAGGNTFCFLKALRKSKLMDLFVQFGPICTTLEWLIGIGPCKAS